MDKHPVFLRMQKLECSDAQKNLAFQLYIHLCEIGKYWDVDFEYCGQLDLIMVTGRRDVDTYETIVPVSCSTRITPQWLNSLHDVLASPTVAVFDSDGTCVLTEICQGIRKPNREQRLRKIDPAVVFAKDLVNEMKDC